MLADDILGMCSADLARPVLIAGPTASGKSSLALQIAQADGRAVINADAIQVYENWRVLTARPSAPDEAAARHMLYGHVAGDQPYSVGTWLREVAPLFSLSPAPVLVGGTGLYFAALTTGLADIPDTPARIRAIAKARLDAGDLAGMVAELDEDTRTRLDTQNPMRVQRAWEVLQTTGHGLAHWQDNTAQPILPLSHATALVIDAPKAWLTPRIEARFDQMLEGGALDEARANLPTWSPDHPSSKAIGASELIAVVSGFLDQGEARERTTIATRQYAKRQRSWFRARMTGWMGVYAPKL
ncbi:MAG: tRNA (adenosine(37)-N6)-dimethylallyltransferase MiaA [Pseudomonadota bacterium]